VLLGFILREARDGRHWFSTSKTIKGLEEWRILSMRFFTDCDLHDTVNWLVDIAGRISLSLISFKQSLQTGPAYHPEYPGYYNNVHTRVKEVVQRAMDLDRKLRTFKQFYEVYVVEGNLSSAAMFSTGFNFDPAIMEHVDEVLSMDTPIVNLIVSPGIRKSRRLRQDGSGCEAQGALRCGGVGAWHSRRLFYRGRV
jgi:hypothetical protein